MDAAGEGDHVMFAVGAEGDVAQHDHFIVALNIGKGCAENFFWVFGIAAKKFFIGFYDATGGVLHAFTVRVVTGPADEGAHGGFGLFTSGFFGFLGGGCFFHKVLAFPSSMALYK